MTDERAGKERDAHFRERVVAVLPLAAVERVHELGLACQDADGHAAAGYLAVSREVRANVEQSLGSAWVNAETRDHFVKDEGGFRCFGDLANFTQELNRSKAGTS